MYLHSTDSKMDLKISCDECHNNMDTNIHIPRSLPCGHTVCQKCLSAALNNYHSPAGCVECCQCKIYFDKSLRLKDFPINYSVFDILALNFDRKLTISASRARSSLLQLRQLNDIYESFIQQNKNQIEAFTNLYNCQSSTTYSNKIEEEKPDNVKTGEILNEDKSTKKSNSKISKNFEKQTQQQNL